MKMQKSFLPFLNFHRMLRIDLSFLFSEGRFALIFYF